MALLTFQRSRSKSKVKTTVLKIFHLQRLGWCLRYLQKIDNRQKRFLDGNSAATYKQQINRWCHNLTDTNQSNREMHCTLITYRINLREVNYVHTDSTATRHFTFFVLRGFKRTSLCMPPNQGCSLHRSMVQPASWKKSRGPGRNENPATSLQCSIKWRSFAVVCVPLQVLLPSTASNVAVYVYLCVIRTRMGCWVLTYSHQYVAVQYFRRALKTVLNSLCRSNLSGYHSVHLPLCMAWYKSLFYSPSALTLLVGW